MFLFDHVFFYYVMQLDLACQEKRPDDKKRLARKVVSYEAISK